MTGNFPGLLRDMNPQFQKSQQNSGRVNKKKFKRNISKLNCKLEKNYNFKKAENFKESIIKITVKVKTEINKKRKEMTPQSDP